MYIGDQSFPLCLSLDHIMMMACPGIPRMNMSHRSLSAKNHTVVNIRIRNDHMRSEMMR